MKQMEVFRNPEFGTVRVIEDNGQYLFCGTDVALALGYSNPYEAIRRHCRRVAKHEIFTNGGLQQANCLTEGDVYRLIARSRLPSAERIEAWLFDEVLPALDRREARSGDAALNQTALPDVLLDLCAELLLEQEKNTIRRRFAGKENPLEHFIASILDW